jgi:hypothetical protein
MRLLHDKIEKIRVKQAKKREVKYRDKQSRKDEQC